MTLFPKNAPTNPGVYLFSDKKGRVLYVGKAKNIRNRLRNYFSKTEKEPKTEAMVTEAHKVRWQITDSEIEALLLEAELIKKYKTRYNVLMRDGKNYTSVAITKEKYPIIYTTHQLPKTIKLSRGATKVEYFGPFTDGAAIKITLKLIQKVFPYCTCKSKHVRPCLNAHIGKCLGYCCLKTTDDKKLEKEYAKQIKYVKEILRGKRKSIARSLTREMKKAGKSGDLEKAIELRNQIEKLNRVFENARVLKDIAGRDEALIALKKIFKLKTVPHRIEGYDISNVHGTDATGSMVVFENGQESKSEYRKFKIKTVHRSDDTAMIREIMRRRFKRDDWPAPDLLIIDGGKGQLSSTISAIEENIDKRQIPPILALAKGPKRKGTDIYSNTLTRAIKMEKLPTSVQNLIRHTDSEAHRFAITFYRSLHRKRLSK